MNETALRQWHDDDGSFRFHSQSLVYFSQCTKKGYLSFNELLRLTSDIAVQDFNVRGMDRNRMFSEGYMILVSRVALRIHSMPRENESITLTTWEEKSEPLQFVRMYEITDTASGEKLVTGESKWLLADSKVRRLLPVKKFTLRTPVETCTEHDCLSAQKIEIPQNLTLFAKRKVVYSDIDANGHTNNSRYGAFAIDSLPEEFQNKNFTDARLNYSREAMLGDTIEIYGAIEENRAVIIGKVPDENGTLQVSFECELYY